MASRQSFAAAMGHDARSDLHRARRRRWKFLDDAWPPKVRGKDVFARDFRAQLAKSPYWPAVKAMNSESLSVARLDGPSARRPARRPPRRSSSRNIHRVAAPESKVARRAQLCASHWVQGSPLPPAAQAISRLRRHLLEPPADKPTLGCAAHPRQRRAIRLGRLAPSFQPPQQIRARRPHQVVVAQLAAAPRSRRSTRVPPRDRRPSRSRRLDSIRSPATAESRSRRA